MSSLLQNLLFPPRCAGCDELIAVRDWRRGEECFCPDCRAAWEMAKLAVCPRCHEAMMDCRCMTPRLEEAGMQSLVKLTAYGTEDGTTRSVADRLLYRIKDKHIVAYEDFLAAQLAPVVRAEMDRRGWLLTDESGAAPFETVVTFCPRSPAKVRKSGTDQAARVAKRLAALLGLTYAPLLLRSDSVEQKTLGQEERRAHAGRAYHLRRGVSVTAKRVLLVDDIVTTGASMAACAESLFASGALSVIGAAVEQVERKAGKNQKNT